MRIAIISDVHGNTWALEAVLEDIERRGCDTIINAGDCVFGPLDPGGTAAILANLDIPTVRGNQDRALTADATGNPTLAFVQKELTRDQVAWFGFLDETRRVGEIFMFHGTPASDEQYLLEEESSGRNAIAADGRIRERLGECSDRVVVCGHTHVPRVVQLDRGPLCVNPGSVGLPAYAVGGDNPHVMESGSPHARYAILERSETGWKVAQVCVDYDYRTAARYAGLNDRPDWAEWIKTGRA